MCDARDNVLKKQSGYDGPFIHVYIYKNVHLKGEEETRREI